MEHHAADELHAVGVQPQHAAGRLAHGGKRLRQDVVERFAALQTRLELGVLACSSASLIALYLSAIASILSTMG